jgi:hypothetical protein
MGNEALLAAGRQHHEQESRLKAILSLRLTNGRSWDAAKVTRHLFEKAFDLLSLRL